MTAGLDPTLEGRVFLIPSSIDATDIARVMHDGYDVSLLHEGIGALVRELSLDLLLLDTHPGLNEETLLSIAVSDAVAIVLRPDQQDYEGTHVTVSVARKLRVPEMMLVVNKTPSVFDAADVKQRVEAAYGCDVAAVLPHSDDLMAFSSRGVFVLDQPDHPLARCTTTSPGASSADGQPCPRTPSRSSSIASGCSAGLPAKRAGTLLFLIESRTARLTAQSREAMQRFATRRGGAAARARVHRGVRARPRAAAAPDGPGPRAPCAALGAARRAQPARAGGAGAAHRREVPPRARAACRRSARRSGSTTPRVAQRLRAALRRGRWRASTSSGRRSPERLRWARARARGAAGGHVAVLDGVRADADRDRRLDDRRAADRARGGRAAAGRRDPRRARPRQRR